MTDLNAPAVRRVARAVALTPAVLVSLAAPAFADPPSAWPDTDSVPLLNVLLVLVVIPAALFVGISLLVYLPSMVRGEKYTPGLAWRNENEWFGGPSGGVEAADPEPESADRDADRGGASARW